MNPNLFDELPKIDEAREYSLEDILREAFGVPETKLASGTLVYDLAH